MTMAIPALLPELDYDYDALEPHYRADALQLHHATHHRKYVEGTNAALESLAWARAEGEFTRMPALEAELAFQLSGHVLHSIFWKNLSPDGGGKPEGPLADAIEECFGDFEAMRRQMETAVTKLHGSGWGALAWEPVTRRLVIEQIYDHQANASALSQPLLVIDGWEHAFYLQHQADKASYLDGIWNIVNWTDVGQRFEVAHGYGPA